MNGYQKWNYNRYLPLDQWEKAGEPYLCRLIPLRDGMYIEWKNEYVCEVFYKERQGGRWQHAGNGKGNMLIHGLKLHCEYEVYIQMKNGKRCARRLVKTGEVIGTPIAYLHPDDRQYSFSGRFLCSPSIVRLPSGALLSSCDVFGPATPQNLTLIFRSDDGGNTWRHVCELMPCFWGRLFYHRGSLYMLATSTEYGDLIIGKSDDEGETWSVPQTIVRGSCNLGRGCHRAPCSILYANGKIYTSLEFGSWRNGFFSTVISIDETADLMRPENWTIAIPFKIESDEPGAEAIEGNLVQALNGDIINILRYKPNEGIITRLDATGLNVEYVSRIQLPFAHTKFEIQQHQNGQYYALGNSYPDRNVLALYTSEDCMKWNWSCDIVNCADCDPEITGFQYPSFVFNEEQLLIAVRTAFNGAENYHNSNYLTFHKLMMDDNTTE